MKSKLIILTLITLLIVICSSCSKDESMLQAEQMETKDLKRVAGDIIQKNSYKFVQARPYFGNQNTYGHFAWKLKQLYDTNIPTAGLSGQPYCVSNALLVPSAAQHLYPSGNIDYISAAGANLIKDVLLQHVKQNAPTGQAVYNFTSLTPDYLCTNCGPYIEYTVCYKSI